MSVELATEDAYLRHRTYVTAVLRRLCAWLDPTDREALLHDAFAVCLEKQHAGTLDLAELAPKQVRAYLTQTALNKAMDESKRFGRRQLVGFGVTELAERELDGEDAPALVALLARADRARWHDVVGELPQRQRAIVELRFFADRTPQEVQRELGIAERVYRRDLERALRALSARRQLVHDGDLCARRRSTILAFVAGICGPNRALLARRHLESCQRCTRWAAAMRAAQCRSALGAITNADPATIDAV